MSDNLIGLGVYTLQEASLYGCLSSNKLSRWVFGTRNTEPVIQSELSHQKLISFRDLVQAMAINKAREFGLPLHKIRKAIKIARTEYGVDFPLAHKHKLAIFDNDLHIVLPDGEILQLSGRYQGQRAMKKVVEPFMKDLHFNTEGIAVCYTPFEKFGRQIILDPERQFGQPLVGDTGYRADILTNVFHAEESAEAVASAYNIDVKDVKAAVEYMKSIRRAA